MSARLTVQETADFLRTLDGVLILTVRGSGAAELVWADGPGLRARSVPSAFARYYAEALRELEVE